MNKVEIDFIENALSDLHEQATTARDRANGVIQKVQMLQRQITKMQLPAAE